MNKIYIIILLLLLSAYVHQRDIANSCKEKGEATHTIWFSKGIKLIGLTKIMSLM